MFYRPIPYAGRHFSRNTEYSAIDWKKLSSVVHAFNEKISEWYIVPAKLLATDWHHSFSLAALDCLLIDTMAQFEKGVRESTSDIFIDFVKAKLPQFAVHLPAKIRRPNGKREITTPAEALYFGFRCGILHEAHIPPYCQVLPEANIVRTETSGMTTYGSGGDCCTVVLDPTKLLTALETHFATYISNLLDTDMKNETLRANFKNKFTSNYGIDINAAT